MGQFEDMQVFIRVVEAGGISAAADQLGIAKSAVSRRISELEARLGTRLLNRTTRRSSLSETGQHYYTQALKIIDDVAELDANTTSANRTLIGTINLAAPLSFGLSHLAPALDAFVKLHPGVSLNIDFSDHQVDLVEAGLDMAFRIAELQDSTLVARKICPISRLLCASPDYLNTYGTPRTPADLKQHKLLHYNTQTPTSWKLLDSRGKSYLIKPRANFCTNNGDFLLDMAICGHGIVASPGFIAWQAIINGDLLPLMPDYHLPHIDAYVLYPKTPYLSRRTRALIDFLLKRFGEIPYWDQQLNAALKGK